MALTGNNALQVSLVLQAERMVIYMKSQTTAKIVINFMRVHDRREFAFDEFEYSASADSLIAQFVQLKICLEPINYFTVQRAPFMNAGAFRGKEKASFRQSFHSYGPCDRRH